MIRTEPLLVDDLEEIEALEGRASDRPWSRGTLGRQLAGKGDFSRVAWIDGPDGERPVGFVIARAVIDAVEILNVLTDPTLRRRGIGRSLIAALEANARHAGHARIILEVREGNRAARGLYEGQGFQVVGRRAGYYREPTEDALLMDRRL